MEPTIDGLLAARELRLRLAGTGPGGSATDTTAYGIDAFGDRASRRRRAAPIDWVHSSDLDDPTEFLSPGTLLLTDGSQFGLEHPERYDYGPYIDRLLGAGVVGLGFATQFLHDGTPPQLLTACVERAFPLIEVPDRIPFIAIIRHVADAIAAERTRAMEWSLGAQRAIALAALKPDGIAAILVELESRLSCRVALFDGAARPLRVAAARGVDARLLPTITDEVVAVLRRGRRAASRLDADGARVTVQTLGQPGGLRGALVLQHEQPLDRAATELVTSVIALASLALEQNRALDESRRALRAGLLELLLAGSTAVARQTATAVWGGFPDDPVTVALLDSPAAGAELRDALEVLADESGGTVFHAERAGRTIVLVEAGGVGAVTEVAGRLGRPVGLSSLVAFAELGVGVDEAAHALRHASRAGTAVARFDDFLGDGVLGLLHSERAERVAARVIAPLVDHDAQHDGDLVEALGVWLDEGCSWERASQRLGIHRHTLRSRIRQAGTVLGIDLDGFEGRLEAWTALRFGARG
ncbi:PucR family transcriptional regulator [Schumannella soli]|uniref:PucR family transcriptional regulator n=2 Tax=Schumannella soli TaxID=2590779 RepID=A0A506XYS0_9MICO|nr:PucR family transcriptional regulator [Schumannella soli]